MCCYEIPKIAIGVRVDLHSLKSEKRKKLNFQKGTIFKEIDKKHWGVKLDDGRSFAIRTVNLRALPIEVTVFLFIFLFMHSQLEILIT